MENKIISIIVPIYNADKTLGRCVESLIGQTYSDIEIILVDDGSKDRSLDLCKRYSEKDRRIRVVSKENGGVSSARNAGLDVAMGKFIMFCDSDDWVEADWCETMLSAYKPDFLVMCGYFCHKPNSVQWIGEEVKEIVISKADYLSTCSIGGGSPWNKLLCRDVIKEGRIRFPEKITLGEDKLFIWRYLKYSSNDIVYCNKPLVHYTWPIGQSLTLNLPLDYYEQCRIIFQEIQTDIDNGFYCSEKSKRQFYQESYYQYENAIRRIFKDKNTNFIKKLKVSSCITNSAEYQIIAHNSIASSNRIACFFCKRKNSFGLYILYVLKKY